MPPQEAFEQQRRPRKKVTLRVTEMVLFLAAALLCVITCVTAKLTTPSFQPSAVAYTPSKMTEATTKEAKKLNLNTVTLAQLMTVEGMEASLAEAILAYRAQYGGFSNVHELGGIEGVGAARLAAWKGVFTVE